MKYNLETIQLINLFENIAKINVKDCFFDKDKLVFIVNEGQGSKAVGKKGINVKKFAEKTNKRIKIIEFSNDPVKFINRYISPIKPESVVQEGKIIKISAKTTKDKGLLIGRNSQNLENLKKVTKKYFKDIEDIKIV